MPEDIAITSSRSDVDPCSHGRETDRQKSADGGKTIIVITWCVIVGLLVSERRASFLVRF